MPVTRKEVAKYAGVSEATVSYVVNNGPRPVATETRQRVQQAIEILGYHPSDVARSLRMQRTSTLGLIVPDTANPFYGEIARIIENVGYENGFTVLLCNSHADPEREMNYLNTLRSKQVAGVAVIPTDPSSVNWLIEAGIHTVVLESDISGAYCLVADDFQGGQTVTRHLLNLGHRRIGFIVREGDTSTSQQRVEGYKAVLAESGIPVDPALIVSAIPETRAGRSAALRLLDTASPPTAIIAHNDSMALGIMAGIRERGLTIPGDVSVVGFDDIAEAAFFDPPLTTVAHPKDLIGQQAARLLIALLQGTHNDPPRTITFEVTLVVRGSTASPGLN